MSPPELALWVRLRTRDEERLNFRRQHPIGPYVLDFYYAKARLAIEVDGQSHDFGHRPERDRRRDAYLASIGLQVVRYLAEDVRRDPNGVAQSIVDTASELCGRRRERLERR